MAGSDGREPLRAKPGLDVDSQDLVDVVDRARLVAAALLVECPPLARCGDEPRTSIRQADAATVRYLTALESCRQVGAGVPCGLGLWQSLCLDVTLLRAVPDNAVVARLAAAASAAVAECAVLLMTGEYSLVAGLRIYPWHGAHLLRFRSVAPALVPDPALEFGDGVEAQLSGIDAAQVRLDVALEVAQ